VLRVVSVCMHAVATAPAEVLSRSLLPVTPGPGWSQHQRPSLLDCQVGFRIGLFEACSAFTHVTACMLAGSPEATLYIRGFSSFVTSTTAPIATGWSDQLPGGDCTH